MNLALPFQPPLEPMLAAIQDTIPDGDGWLYEPKWDGFRALVFFDGTQIYLQSRDSRPLGRYFPEVEAGLVEVLPGPAVLDGEVVVMTDHGLDFDALQLRLHPAESRVRKLAAETPAQFVAFDLLADGGEDLRGDPFQERHARLTSMLASARPPLYRTPSTTDHAQAEDWFERFEGAGFDGVIAKRLDDVYRPGVRSLVKIKHRRTADCVVAGFRWAKDHAGVAVGSLLLGLYDAQGVLHHVGHTSSF
ncbi:MAG: ATP-dependent DNA ligase, partial [Dehalococcoidia bacterium]